MSKLPSQCYQEGFEARARELMKPMVKSALNPMVGGKMILDPLRRRELAVLGEKLFRDASTPRTGMIDSLKALLTPGYNQLGTVKTLNRAHIDNVRGMGSQLKALRAARGATPRDPNVQALIQKIRQAGEHHRGQQQQLFTEIGQTAEPRLKAIDRGLPAAAAGLGAGAVGTGAGMWAGHERGESDVANQFANLPILQRLKYLLVPQAVSGNLLQKS